MEWNKLVDQSPIVVTTLVNQRRSSIDDLSPKTSLLHLPNAQLFKLTTNTNVRSEPNFGERHLESGHMSLLPPSSSSSNAYTHGVSRGEMCSDRSFAS